jgi:hypothetical protein
MTQTPPTPPGFPQLAALSSISSIGNMFARDMYAKPEDAEEFERRVERYLAPVRENIVSHLVRTIVKSDENKIYFIVGNDTDDSVVGVQLTVVIPSDGSLLCTVPPSAEPLPRLPKWPDPVLDRMASVGGRRHN